MTIQEALEKLRPVAPDNAVNVQINVWDWPVSQYRKQREIEVEYSIWCEAKHYKANTLEVAVEMALDGHTTESTSQAETRLAEARELVVKQSVTCLECDGDMAPGKDDTLACTKCGFVLSVP